MVWAPSRGPAFAVTSQSPAPPIQMRIELTRPRLTKARRTGSRLPVGPYGLAVSISVHSPAELRSAPR